MAKIQAMTTADAHALEVMMKGEKDHYLQYFTAFKKSGALQHQVISAQRDKFFLLAEEADKLAGFFCLRGMDAGFTRPSFGVYIAKDFRGRGLARLALKYSASWCREQGISKIMLKVAEDNKKAYKLYHAAGFGSLGVCADTHHIIMEMRLE